MSSLKDSQHIQGYEFDLEGSNGMSRLMPISENLDADDESDCSDFESETERTENEKRTRKSSLNQVVYQHKARSSNRQRKTSCIELYNSKNKKNFDEMIKKSSELPPIKRSMSLPESFESFEAKKPPKGSRSAAARLRLPEIGQNVQQDPVIEKNSNSKRSFLFLPNLVKKDSKNGVVDFQQMNNTEAKKLDLFMRSKFR